MFGPGMRVGVAVSGGCDSISLLHLLHELGPRWNLHLSVVHIEHGLRGEASQADAEFVRNEATRLGLPFHLHEARLSDAPGNREQAARNARRKFFRELIRTGKLDRVATGHTRSDQAETVLYRFLRGAGLTGLRGILPVTDEGIVRPLLDTDRADLRVWATESNLHWREDETNRDLSYARNRIRHELLPELQSNYNPRLEEALAHLATLARDEEDYWRTQTPAVELRRGAAILSASALASTHPAIARRWLRFAIERVKGNLQQIEFQHIEAVLNSARAPEGRGRLEIPGLTIQRSFDGLRLAAATPAGSSGYEIPISVPSTIPRPNSESTLAFELACQPNSVIPPPQIWLKHDKLEGELDWYSLIPNPAGQDGPGSGLLVLRNWRPGDRYRPAGRPHEYKLKFLFQEARVPVWERRDWPVLTLRDRIVWVGLFGPSHDCQPTERSRVILRIVES